ncbi:diaminobutyrate acetyltransferase [Paenibacillus ferrarius]|uniref:diaminobutyrate acetyltransferase n=1 Tax=Paenibacillus ferrarius TaxID=1469647 RepID=UPI003D2C65D2
MEAQNVIIRTVRSDEGQFIWQSVVESQKLDINSAYCYIMLCHYFSETCWVAEVEGNMAGFVTAFIHPSQPEVLFVWQIAVSAKHRGKGLAQKLLQQLLASEHCRHVRYVETTISPDNEASKRLFAKIAEELDAPIVEGEGFPVSLFPAHGHADERLIRIGAIPKTSANSKPFHLHTGGDHR